MVGPLIIGGALLAAKQFGLLGKKSGKIFDLSSGPIGKAMLGAGVGGFLNWADGKFLGGAMQKIYVGSPQKGMNLSATDAATVALTVGIGGLNKKSLMAALPIVAGKKVGEYTGAIDPIELIPSGRSVQVVNRQTGGGYNA